MCGVMTAMGADPEYRRPIRIYGGGHIDGFPSARRRGDRHISLPAAREHDISSLINGSVTGVGHIRIGSGGRQYELRETRGEAYVSPIDDVVDHRAVRIHGIDGFQNREGGRVGNFAVGVARRELKIGDNGVAAW